MLVSHICHTDDHMIDISVLVCFEYQKTLGHLQITVPLCSFLTEISTAKAIIISLYFKNTKHSQS